MKSFFKEDTSLLTDEGSKLQLELDSYFKVIFTKYKEMGYSIREIPQMIYSSSSLIESLESLRISNEIDKVKKESRIRTAASASKSKKVSE